MAAPSFPHMYPFRFSDRRAAAAAAYLLSLEENRSMDYMRLVKLLYFAEREALARLGHPITGDRYYSLDRGPVLSLVLDLCKQDTPFSEAWAHQIERLGRWAVRLKGDPDVTALSQAELDILGEISKRHWDDDQWSLSKISHGFSEWQDPRGSRLEILPADILRAMGKKAEEIRDILEDIEDTEFVQDKLGG